MRNKANTTIIAGPPGAGKTTYIERHRGSNDLIIDLDAIVSAISGKPWYQASTDIIPFAWEARDAVIRRLAREGSPVSVWIAATLPDKTERGALAGLLGASVVVIETDPETCKQRISGDKRRSEDAERYFPLVDSWWNEYQPCHADKVIKQGGMATGQGVSNVQG